MSPLLIVIVIVLVFITMRNFYSKVRNAADAKFEHEWKSYGTTLLHEAFYLGSKTEFLQILSGPGKNLEARNKFGKTVLQVALETPLSYSKFHIDALLDSGAKIENVDNFLLLENSIGRPSHHLLQRVLQLGVDPNLQNSKGQTILHLLLLGVFHQEHFYSRATRNSVPDICEKVFLLLLHGADPTIECYSEYLNVPKPWDRGYNAFEIAVLKNHPGWLQEHLFLSTYDEHERIKIDFLVVIRLAKHNMALFLQVLKVADLCADSFCDIKLLMFFEDFFSLNLDDFRILVDKCLPHLCQVFGLYQHVRVDGLSLNVSYLKSNQILHKFEFLISSSVVLRDHLIHGFFGYLSPYCFWSVIKVNTNPELATELITYFMQHGAKLYASLYSVVFSTYGYCSLYKFLLSVESQEDYFPKQIKSSFIYEFDLDLVSFLERNCLGYDCKHAVNQLLDCFAHWKLSEFLKKNTDEFGLSESDLKRIDCHPKVPCLVEISRNVFRRHVIEKFNVKNTRQFYNIVKALPIANVYKKIVTYETKLYYT